MHVEGFIIVAWQHLPPCIIVVAIIRAIRILGPVGALAYVVFLAAALALRVEAELSL